MYATLAGATNSTECTICQAGSYGSGSGKWMMTGAISKARAACFSLHSRVSWFRCKAMKKLVECWSKPEVWCSEASSDIQPHLSPGCQPKPWFEGDNYIRSTFVGRSSIAKSGRNRLHADKNMFRLDFLLLSTDIAACTEVENLEYTARRFLISLRVVGQVGFAAHKTNFRHVTYATLAGFSICDLCQAGSYGTVSGEWMWKGTSVCEGGLCLSVLY